MVDAGAAELLARRGLAGVRGAGRRRWVISDRTWRCTPGDAWTPVPVPGDVACLPLESFDARAHADGWDHDSFDDSDWRRPRPRSPRCTPAVARDPHPPSEPFGMLRPPVRVAVPRRRRAPRHARRASAVRRGGDTRARSGRARSSRDQARDRLPPESGRRADTLRPRDASPPARSAHDAGRAPGTVDRRRRGRAPRRRRTARHPRTTRGLSLRLRGRARAGLRVVRRHRHPVPARLGSSPVGAAPARRSDWRSTTGIGPAPTGASFECSDPQLQRIFDVGLRTVDLCALDAYVDCPTREQRAWTGDSVVHQMVDLVTNPDWSMADLAPATGGRTPPRRDAGHGPGLGLRRRRPDVRARLVVALGRSVHNLYRYTGDRDLVADLLPVAERTLRWFEAYLGDDGLLADVTGWVLLDWASVYSSGCSSTLNALWARASRTSPRWRPGSATMAPRAGPWRRRATVGRRSTCSGTRSEGSTSTTSWTACPAARSGPARWSGALAAGLVPGRVARVVDRLTDRPASSATPGSCTP